MLKSSNICCKHITYNGLQLLQRYGTPYQTIILLGKTIILISFRNSLRPTILDKCIAFTAATSKIWNSLPDYNIIRKDNNFDKFQKLS